MKPSPYIILLNLVLIIFLTLFCVTNASYNSTNDPIMLKRYQNWVEKYRRKYQDKAEWNIRFGIYQSNVEFIDYFNSLNLSYSLTDNEFADMTNHEFTSIYLGYKQPRQKQQDINNATYYISKLPVSVDWRKNGAVTPVKDQKNCGTYQHKNTYVFFCVKINILDVP